MNHAYLSMFALVSTLACLCVSVVLVLRRPARYSAATLIGSTLLFTGMLELRCFGEPGLGILFGVSGSLLLLGSNTILVAWRNR